MNESFVWLLAIILMITGLLGTVLPILPGAPVAFLGMLLLAYADDFQRVGVTTVVILGILSGLTLLIDIFASSRGAKRAGASKMAITGATLGAIGGIFFGPIGIVIGPFVGAVLGEVYSTRDLVLAGKVGLATTIALAIGIAVKLTLTLFMIVYFFTAYFWN